MSLRAEKYSFGSGLIVGGAQQGPCVATATAKSKDCACILLLDRIPGLSTTSRQS